MYTRRKFLIEAIWLVVMPASFRALALEDEGSVDSGELTVSQRVTLAAVMDQIIPAFDGMPSASQAGRLQYLQSLGWQYPEIRDNIRSILNILGRKSDSEFHHTFTELGPDQRLYLLKKMEKAALHENLEKHAYNATF